MGQVYYISRGHLKPANKKFSSVKNDYELNLNDDTEVEVCVEGTPDIPILARPGGPPNPSYSISAAPPSRPGFDVSHSQQRSVFPIASLSPYQSKWTIRVRVASKPSIITWSNSRGEGRVLNVDLVDETGEIRACAFNEAADKLQSQLEMGQVYYISRGHLLEVV
jgi:ssDNA-binding replication factor A large subunit